MACADDKVLLARRNNRQLNWGSKEDEFRNYEKIKFTDLKHVWKDNEKIFFLLQV